MGKVTHGMGGTKFNQAWHNMINRCTDKKRKGYHNYGGRGIKICDRWMEFENFKADMLAGYVEGLQLDRKDNDGNYTPENCRWVTKIENCNNIRKNVHINTSYGRNTLAETARLSGISIGTIWYRMKIGWEEKDLLLPLKMKKGVRKRKKNPSEKLILKIKKDCPDIPISETAVYQRLYPGHIQRFNGAWNWHIINNNAVSIGSQWTVNELLKSKKLTNDYWHGDFSIFP